MDHHTDQPEVCCHDQVETPAAAAAVLPKSRDASKESTVNWEPQEKETEASELSTQVPSASSERKLSLEDRVNIPTLSSEAVQLHQEKPAVDEEAFVASYTRRLAEIAHKSDTSTELDLGIFLCSFYVGLVAMPANSLADLAGTDVVRNLLLLLKYRVTSTWSLCTAHSLLALLVLDEGSLPALEDADSAVTHAKQEMISQFFDNDGPELVVAKLYEQVQMVDSSSVSGVRNPTSSLLSLVVLVRCPRGRRWLQQHCETVAPFKELMSHSKTYLNWSDLSMQCGLQVKVTELVDEFISFMEHAESTTSKDGAQEPLEEGDGTKRSSKKKKKKRSKKHTRLSMGLDSDVLSVCEFSSEEDLSSSTYTNKSLPKLCHPQQGTELQSRSVGNLKPSSGLLATNSTCAHKELNSQVNLQRQRAASETRKASEEFPPISRECQEQTAISETTDGWVKLEQQTHMDQAASLQSPGLSTGFGTSGPGDQRSYHKAGPMRWADVAKIGCPREQTVDNFTDLLGESSMEEMRNKVSFLCTKPGDNSRLDMAPHDLKENDNLDMWLQIADTTCGGYHPCLDNQHPPVPDEGPFVGSNKYFPSFAKAATCNANVSVLDTTHAFDKDSIQPLTLIGAEDTKEGGQESYSNLPNIVGYNYNSTTPGKSKLPCKHLEMDEKCPSISVATSNTTSSKCLNSILDYVLKEPDSKSLVNSFNHLPALKDPSCDTVLQSERDSLILEDTRPTQLPQNNIRSEPESTTVFSNNISGINGMSGLLDSLRLQNSENAISTNTQLSVHNNALNSLGSISVTPNNAHILNLTNCVVNAKNMGYQQKCSKMVDTTSKHCSFPVMCTDNGSHQSSVQESSVVSCCKTPLSVNSSSLSLARAVQVYNKSTADNEEAKCLTKPRLDILSTSPSLFPGLSAKATSQLLTHVSRLNYRQGANISANTAASSLQLVKPNMRPPDLMKTSALVSLYGRQLLGADPCQAPQFFENTSINYMNLRGLRFCQPSYGLSVENGMDSSTTRKMTNVPCCPRNLSWAERARQTPLASSRVLTNTSTQSANDFPSQLTDRLHQREIFRQLQKQCPSQCPAGLNQNDSSPPVLFPSVLRDEGESGGGESETYPTFHDLALGDLMSELLSDPLFIEKVAIHQLRQTFLSIYCCPVTNAPLKDSVFESDLDYYASLYRVKLRDMLIGPMEKGGFGDLDGFHMTHDQPCLELERSRFSRRWREALNRLLSMPWTMRKQFGHLILPRNLTEYNISHTDYPLVLGFTTEGTEVAVLILDKSVAYIDPCLLDIMRDPDLDRHFMLKCKGVSETSSTEYVGLELCDYTLSEYIQIVQLSQAQDPVSVNRLGWQLLEGLRFLHKYLGMAHGNLKPTWIFVDSEGRLRLGGYGIVTRHVKGQGHIRGQGTDRLGLGRPACWSAAEELNNEQAQTNTAADIQVAGMLLYFILSGGHHPFGSSPLEAQINISRHHVCLDLVANEEATHLISAMLNPEPSHRPKVEQCLKHPFFWSNEKKFRLILVVGSDVLTEMKTGVALTGCGAPTMMEILSVVDINDVSTNWVVDIHCSIMKEMRSFRVYKNNLAELTLFIYNCCLHFEKLSPVAKEALQDPCKYFLNLFPSLFMAIYRSLLVSDRAEQSCYKPFL